MAAAPTLQKVLPELWRILRRFWPDLRRQQRLVGLAMLGLLAQVGFKIMEPWPLKLVFDRVLVSSPGLSLPLAGELGLTATLLLAALSFAAIAALAAAASFWSRVAFATVGQRVLSSVRGQVFRQLQLLSLSFHNRARSGDLALRVIGDIALIRDAVVTALLPLLARIMIMLAMGAVMFWFSWQLSLIALATVPLLWFRTVHLSRRIQLVARRQRQRRGTLAASAVESFGAIRTVQALSLGETFARGFIGTDERNLKEGVQARRLAAQLERTAVVVTAIATGLVLFFGARQVISETLTPGDLLVVLFYLKSTFRPVKDFAKYAGRLAKATAAGERILDVLDETPEIRDLPGAVDAGQLRGEIHFEAVSFAYEKDCAVLDEISLKVAAGHSITLAGPSGGGKSTLLSLILRLYEPARGRVLIDGCDIRDFTLDSLRSQISVVLQDSALFKTSVRNNIGYGSATATGEAIVSAARLANAHDFIMALPDGYDTVLGERGVTLSQGQRQRLSIARAAVRKAPILLLDEPTAGLDEENARAVVEALRRLARGRTTILVTHDLRLGADSDMICYLENGCLLETGTHDELIAEGGRYAGVFLHQTSPVSGDFGEEKHSVNAT